MPQKITIIKKFTLNFNTGTILIPPCAGPTVLVEAFGQGSAQQCLIPLSGGYKTTATIDPLSLTSGYGGGSYARSVLTLSTGSTLNYQLCSDAWVYANTSSWLNPPTTAAVGVVAKNGAERSTYPAGQIGQLIYPGGRNGRKYYTCARGGSADGCPCLYFIWGGQGGQAGPNGPGGDGISARPQGCWQTTITYAVGYGGGANGGAAATTSSPGLSRWGTLFSGGGGTANRNSIDYTGYGYGSVGGACGSYCSTNFCVSCDQKIVVTYTQGFRTISSGTYRYIFVNRNCASNYRTDYASMFTIPAGTTQIVAEVLGGGADGNTSSALNATTGTLAGGGGGGYAKSTLVQTFTVPSVGCYTVAGIGGGASSVSINGVTQAQAWSAIDYRGGGTVAFRTNSAANGVVYSGGSGGWGYSSGSTRRGGGGGGAAWSGGAGGNGGYIGSCTGSSTYRSGGGGAASASAAGGAAVAASTTTNWGGGGGLGGGVAGTGGAPVLGGSSGSYVGRNGNNGGGGGAGTNVTGQGIFDDYGGSGSAYPVYTSSTNVIVGGAVGPSGGGGGSYGSQSTYCGRGGSAAGYCLNPCKTLYGGFGGGGGGGKYSGGSGSPGLVVLTLTIDQTQANGTPVLITSSNGYNVNGNGSLQFNSFIPANTLLLAHFGIETDSSEFGNITSVTGGGLIWAKLIGVNAVGSTSGQAAHVWYAINTVATPAFSVFFKADSYDDMAWVITAWGGVSLSNPFGGTATYGGSSGSPNTAAFTLTNLVANSLHVVWDSNSLSGGIGSVVVNPSQQIAVPGDGGGERNQYTYLGYRNVSELTAQTYTSASSTEHAAIGLVLTPSNNTLPPENSSAMIIT